jgi:hypothetical protein
MSQLDVQKPTRGTGKYGIFWGETQIIGKPPKSTKFGPEIKYVGYLCWIF